MPLDRFRSTQPFNGASEGIGERAIYISEFTISTLREHESDTCLSSVRVTVLSLAARLFCFAFAAVMFALL